MENIKRPVLTLNRKRRKRSTIETTPSILTVNKRRRVIIHDTATSVDNGVNDIRSPNNPCAKSEQNNESNNNEFRSGKTRRHLNYTKRKMAKVFEHFPELNIPEKPLPLAINIHLQMIEFAQEKNIEISENDIKKALTYYTLQRKYLLAIIKYNWRRDIDGNKTTKITNADKAYAASKLSRSNKP